MNPGVYFKKTIQRQYVATIIPAFPQYTQFLPFIFSPPPVIFYYIYCTLVRTILIRYRFFQPANRLSPLERAILSQETRTRNKRNDEIQEK